MRNPASTYPTEGYGADMKGVVIKRWRIVGGLTQTDLAIKAGISLSTVQKIEANKYEPPRSTVRALCDAMGHTLAEYDDAAGGMLDQVVAYAERLSTVAQLHLAHELADRGIFAAPGQSRRNISAEEGGEGDLPSYAEIRIDAASTLLRQLEPLELRAVGEQIPITVAKVLFDAAKDSEMTGPLAANSSSGVENPHDKKASRADKAKRLAYTKKVSKKK